MSKERTSGKRPTSYDVAKLAGVSQATVSLVLSGKGEALGISALTKEKVLEAAKSLAYYPNSLIRSIQKNRTGIIGLYAENHGWGAKSSYWSDVLASLHAVVAANDLDLLVFGESPGRSPEKLLERMLGGILDGILIQPGDSDINRALVRSPIPMVCIGGVHADVPGVTVDYVGGMRLAVDHLHEKGYRNLALLSLAVTDIGSVHLRRESFISRAQELGVANSADCVHTTQAGFSKAMDRILSSSPRVDALICFNDDMACSAIDYIKKRGKRVPQDIAVVGFDGIEFPYSVQKLTTLSWSRHSMCQNAVDLLQNEIRGEKATSVVTIPTELFAGETT